MSAEAISIDEDRAARKLAEGVSREEVEALCPGVDLDKPALVDLAAWYRNTADGARRLTAGYLAVRSMEELEAKDESGKPIMPARERRLLLQSLLGQQNK